MNVALKIMIRIYNLLLHLYPKAFRNEFAEQMLLDFSDMAVDASEKGIGLLVSFCLRELVDFPFNLLRIYSMEFDVFKTLGSQPVRNGVRGATGFGAGFAFTSMAAWLVSSLIYAMFDLILQHLPDRIHHAAQNSLLYLIPFSLYLALTGTIFGALLAVFRGNRINFYRYVLAGALCWIIPEVISHMLVGSLGEAYYHNENLMPVLGYSMCILMGVFFSATYVIAESDRKEPLRYLAAGIIIYPLGTYLFINLLFYLWHEITPLFSLSLLVFMIVLIMGVVALTMPGRRKLYFLVTAGGVLYFLLNRALFYIAYHIPGFSPALDMGIIPDVFIVPMYYIAIYKAVFGALFGLSIGWMFGIAKRTDPYALVESI